MPTTLPYKPLLIALWIANCLFGIFIAVKEVWLPYMDAANVAHDTYANIASDPFDGTVMPLDYIPNWTVEAYRDKTIRFDSIPQSGLLPLPSYNPSALQQNNPSDMNLFRAQFTYVVPYM